MSKYYRIVKENNDDSLYVISTKIEHGSIVLDIGAGIGALGSYLSNNYGCVCDCIVHPAHELTENFSDYNIYFADLDSPESIAELSLDKKYDYIIVADVIEHLKDASALLDFISKILATNSHLIISIPNIAYIGIVASLLANDFEYSEEGLLDNTHVKFYTLKTILKLLENSNFKIKEVQSINKSIYNSEFNDHRIDYLGPEFVEILKCFPHLSTYQYIIVCQIGCVQNKNFNLMCDEKQSIFLSYVTEVFLTSIDSIVISESPISQIITGGLTKQLVSFQLPHECGSINFRWDPANRELKMRLHSLTIKNDSRTIYIADLKKVYEIIKRKENLNIIESNGILNITCLSEDAQIYFSVPIGYVDGLDKLYVEFEIDLNIEHQSLMLVDFVESTNKRIHDLEIQLRSHIVNTIDSKQILPDNIVNISESNQRLENRKSKEKNGVLLIIFTFMRIQFQKLTSYLFK
jgi:2-polyprenyl-3-methyl-5-hydroxy-6-metoxy-1,4-benzoquinol methylase